MNNTKASDTKYLIKGIQFGPAVRQSVATCARAAQSNDPQELQRKTDRHALLMLVIDMWRF